MTISLGRLERCELRHAWKDEAANFTPWLAQADNLALLAETMGLAEDSLELQQQEASVGPFRADILCRNTDDNSLVLIENQLERTDHKHLGQLLTYAAGLNAVTLVWIAERFTEEHRAALDWLNDITNDTFHAFGFEIELWRVGDSQPAPKFNVAVQPNDWVKLVREASMAGARSEIDQLKLDFWAAFGQHIREQKAGFREPSLSQAYTWHSWGLGRSGFLLCAHVNMRDGIYSVYVNVQGPDVVAFWGQLREREQLINGPLGPELQWEEGAKERKIVIRRDGVTSEPSNWPAQHDWLLAQMIAFDQVFRPIIKTLDAAEWQPEEEPS